MIDDLLSRCLHTERHFFPKFQLMADHLVEAANMLTDMISLEDERNRQEDCYDHIKELETECDNISTSVFDALGETRFTPFAQADMHELCDAMDDVMDFINSSAKRMMLYQPKNMSNSTMHMAEIVIECAKAIQLAMTELPNLKNKPAAALEQCQRLHDLEHEGDDVYGDFVQELFETEQDARELIKIKEIMAGLEKATDCANKVGKTLKTIIAQYL